MISIRRIPAVLLPGLLLAGCSGSHGHMGGMMNSPGGPSGMGASRSTGSTSNGERIYFTAQSSSGAPITYVGGPAVGHLGGMGHMACVTCHGPGGHGGSTAMMGLIVHAPDITWPALTGDDPPYTEDTVKTAITKGVDPAGDPLDPLMPRWSMTPGDIDDLVAYLKTLR